jgi:ribonuclease-3
MEAVREYDSPVMSTEEHTIEEVIGYRFQDAALLERAMTHASATQGGVSNERLEFLGDAVAGFVVCSHLFRALPEATEGEMTVIKSRVVSRRTMARVARDMGLHRYLKVDEGLGARTIPSSIQACVYEALVGAIYLDGGMEPARRFVLRTLGDDLEEAEEDQLGHDFKSQFQKLTQARGQGTPRYRTVRAEGPDHRPIFHSTVTAARRTLGEGRGRSKQAAEQEAARDALAGDAED